MQRAFDRRPSCCACCAVCRYVFDHLLVLPEYVVEFQYELSQHSTLLAKAAAAAGAAAIGLALSAAQAQAAMDALEPELR